MKVVCIYGLPAVGKLVVAQSLAHLTGFSLLPLHLTVDLVSSVFPINSTAYDELSSRIRLSLIEAAANAHHRGIVFSYGYSGHSEPFARGLCELISKFHGSAYFVYLYCTPESLYQRVKSPGRRIVPGKIRSVRVLKKILEAGAFPPLQCVDNLRIDNSILSPQIVAEQIQTHFSL